MSIFAIILLAVFWLVLIGASMTTIIINYHSDSFKEVKKLVKQNKDVAPFYLDYCYKREKAKIEELLEKHNYKLIEKKTKEERVVYGCGEIEFADGSRQYQVYFSENWCSPITEHEYKSLKKELGKKVTFVSSVETVYTNEEITNVR